ncbi:MAG: hypothetical protein VB087_07975 [Candidatus Limiplasma sp.]|nr:hypothetical protein [Candidatus Limiplasma sp.]MEA5144913.1 hypothetical protein [Candidatus Limiplasma sp.]
MRYFEPGDFTLRFTRDEYYQLPPNQGVSIANRNAVQYVMLIDEVGGYALPGCGLVEKIEETSTIKGAYVDITGRMAEAMIWWPIVNTPISCNAANLSAFCRARADTYLVDGTSPLVLRPTAANIGGVASFTIDNQSLGEALAAECKKQDIAQILHPASETIDGKLYWYFEYRLRIGDTYTQYDFGADGLVASESSLIQDSSAYVNYAYVSYGDGLSLTIDRRGGTTRKRAVYIASSVQRTGSQTNAQYQAAVAADANTQLNQYPIALQFEAKPTSDFYESVLALDKYNGLGWLVRYDTYPARITEVSHTWDAGVHDVTLRFGDLMYKTGITPVIRRA